MILSNHFKGVLITIVGVLAITPDGLLVRLVDTDVWTLLFWRGMGSGFCILVALTFVRRGVFLSDVHAIGWPGIVFSIVFGLGNVSFIISFSLTSAANVLFIVASVPVFSAIIAMIFLKEAIHIYTWLGILVALFGVGVILSGSFNAQDGSILGDLFALGATLTMAISLCIARKWRDRSMVPAMGLAGIITAALSVPFLVTLSVAGWSVIFLMLMSVLCAVGFGLMTMGPRYITAPEVGLIVLLESVIGPYWVWLVLEEEPGMATIIGGIIIIMTLALLNFIIFLKEREAGI